MSLSSDFASSGTAIRATDFNANVASVRQATVSPGTGMLVDNVPMGGTIVTPLSQKRMIRSKVESKFIPFALRSVNVGSKASPSWKKIVYFPDGACDLIGGWAMCDNDVFDGAPVWSKTGDWYYIADSTGNPGSSHIPDQSQVENVYLHVLKAADGDEMVRSAIFTNSQLIPEDFNGYETDCICIGKFSCPTSAEISAGQMPRVLEQYVSGQVQVYGDLFPLKLTVVNIGTDADPEWVKAFWFSEGSVLYDGDIFAECHNKPYPGFTMGDEGLYFVANPQGSNTQVPLQEDVGYAFLHVKFIDGATPKCVAVVTNDDVTIPAEFAGTEDYCCCLGRFTCPSPAQVAAGVVPAVDQQFITSQVQVGVASTGSEDRPFKIKRINVGTEESPTWKTAVYIPAGAVQHNSTITGATIVNDCTPITGHTGWYECPNDSTHQGVYLQMVTGDNSTQIGGRSSTVLHFKLHNSSVQTGGWPSTTYAMTRYCVVALGSVDVSQNTAVTYGVAPINVNDDYLDMKWYHDGHGGGGGGGDGDKVVIDDKREDKSKPGVAIFDHEANIDNQHRVFFSIYDTLGVDKVVFGDEDGQGLADYLAGTIEITSPQNLGKNVNTNNFADECLEQAYERPDTMDFVGESEIASRSDHKHSVDEILGYDEEGTLISIFSNADNFKTLLAELNIWGDLEEPLDPDNPDGTILAASDVNWDDGSQLKHDGESASPGGTGDYAFIALADHVHPLNCVDAEPVPDGGTSPDPNDYILPVGSFIIDPTTGEEDHYQADFGEQPYYARVDHIHPLSENVVTTDTEQDITSEKTFVCPIFFADEDLTDLALIKADSTNGLTLDGLAANKVVLATAPNVETSNTSSLAVATCGWSSGKFVPKSSNSTGFIYDNANGTVSYKAFGTGTDNVARGDHTHSQYGTVKQVAGVSPTNGNVLTASLVAALQGTTDGTLATGNHTHTHDNIKDFDDAVKDLMDDEYAKKADFAKDDDDMFEDPFAQHAHWANGILVAKSGEEYRLDSYFNGVNINGEKVGNLTADKFVKTNSSGTLTTCPEGEEPLVDDPDDPYLKESDVYGTGAATSDYIALMDGDGLLNLSDYSYQDLDDTYNAIFDEDGNVKVATLVPKSGDQGASQTYAPQNVLTYSLGHTETEQEKIARCGTSTYAAREDHKHVLEACSAISSILTNEVCTVGLTNQVDGVGTVGNVQMFRVHTFMSQVSDDMMNIYYRPLKFDKYGRFIGLDSEVLLCSSVWRG